MCLQENIKFRLIIFKTLIGQGEYYDQLILMEFRFPRMLITILAGALSLSGAIIQSVTKNPIAEPGILGINGGGFAIALFISIGQINPDNFVYVLPVISVIGGVATAIVIFLFSVNKKDGITPSSMVLIGVGMQTPYMVVLLRLCLNLMKISQNL